MNKASFEQHKNAVCDFSETTKIFSLSQAGTFEKYGVRILGTPIKSIIDSEDRKLFAERIAEIGEQVPVTVQQSMLEI